MGSSTIAYWKRPFPILGMSSVIFYFQQKFLWAHSVDLDQICYIWSGSTLFTLDSIYGTLGICGLTK